MSAEHTGTCTIDSLLTQAGRMVGAGGRPGKPARNPRVPPKEGHEKADYLLYDEYPDFCMQRRVEDSLAGMLNREVEALKAAGKGCGR